MSNFSIKNIIFDFDGVIIDSMSIRADGVREVFCNYDKNLVEEFVEYYKYNAGLSKFSKIKYFYNSILKKNISEEKVNEYSDQLSKIMKKKLILKEVLIKDTVDFIKCNYKKYNMSIASGSEEKELNYLCEQLEIKKYFRGIYGAPLHKNDIVKNIIKNNNYNLEETILIGDSINDFDAAKVNNIGFYGFNNESLKNKSDIYIDSYDIFEDI